MMGLNKALVKDLTARMLNQSFSRKWQLMDETI